MRDRVKEGRQDSLCLICVASDSFGRAVKVVVLLSIAGIAISNLAVACAR
jgi:hypothetical protein